MKLTALAVAVLVLPALSALAQQAASAPAGAKPAESVFLTRPDDPSALHLTDEAFGAKGDGQADDAPALQKAIDEAAGGAAVVFVGPGTYRLGGSVDLWKGVRVIGYGPRRPVFLVAKGTPAFARQQDGKNVYVFRFRDRKPAAGQELIDAKNTTFCSALWNVDVEIAPDNPAATACYFNVAQGCFLKDVDFRLAADAAGIEQIGNEISRCRFFGGRWAIRTGGTSAGWQSLLMDCHFQGQAEQAIRSHSAGLTLIRCRFAGVPHAVVIAQDKTENLYLADCELRDISGEAIVADQSDGIRSQINVLRTACVNVPKPVGVVAEDFPAYVLDLTAGTLLRAKLERGWAEVTRRAVKALPERRGDVPPLPPVSEWASVRQFGTVGDGKTDDTEALRKAIAGARVIFLPAGRYLLSDTVQLKADTVLIGLHPRKAMLVLASGTAGFGDAAKPRPMLIAPPGGRNIVCGIGFEQGNNAGSAAVKWQASEQSMLDDAWVLWTAKEHKQYAGLWVDGGGGTFKNLWSPNNAAQVGMLVTDTDVPGRVYLASVEHQVAPAVAVRMKNVRNWDVLDLQTEHSDPELLAVEMEGCRDVSFANLYLYRTSGCKAPAPIGVEMTGCDRIAFRGVQNFSLSKFPYDHTLAIKDRQQKVSHKRFALFELDGSKKPDGQ